MMGEQCLDRTFFWVFFFLLKQNKKNGIHLQGEGIAKEPHTTLKQLYHEG